MERSLYILLICIFLALTARSQPETRTDYKNFPLVFMVQFQNLSMPFKDIKSNFSHIGFGVGTEFSYTGKSTFVQQFNISWHRNRVNGNGLLLYSQAVWRPDITNDLYSELKGGFGYLYSWRPTESFRLKQGRWVSAGKTGKGMLSLPIGVSIGYHLSSYNTITSPFITYQLLLVSGYNPSIPVVPETFIQVGSRIHFVY